MHGTSLRGWLVSLFGFSQVLRQRLIKALGEVYQKCMKGGWFRSRLFQILRQRLVKLPKKVTQKCTNDRLKDLSMAGRKTSWKSHVGEATLLSVIHCCHDLPKRCPCHAVKAFSRLWLLSIAQCRDMAV